MKELRRILTETAANQDIEPRELKAVLEKVQTAIRTEDELYTLMARITGNFYQTVAGGRAAAYLFTDRDVAEHSARRVAAQGVTVRPAPVPVKGRLGFFHDLYRSGFEAVILNPDQPEESAFSLFDIISRPSADKTKLMNPGLLRAVNLYLQQVEKGNVAAQQEEAMSRELSKAEFLVPVDGEGHRMDIVVDNARGEKYAPVFTDPVEMVRFAKNQGWQAAPLRFRKIRALAAEHDGVLVNPGGCKIRLSLEKIDHILDEFFS